MRPQQLREDLRHEETDALRNRRLLTGLSLAGMAAMTPVVLLQTGIIRHLPDPPIERFNSDKVNLSKTAFNKGTPDGAIFMMSLAANIVLAGLGGANRAERKPWVPLVAAVKASLGAAMAGMLFYKMGWKLKAWCGYCITGAAVNAGIFLLTLPEAKKALNTTFSDEGEESATSYVQHAGERLVGAR